jgi:predicted ester cyclase
MIVPEPSAVLAGKENLMPTSDNEAIGRRFFAEQDRLKGGLSEDLCAEGYTAEINGFPPMDRVGHEGMGVGFYAAFPDMHQIIEDTVADDQHVAMRFRAKGTHQGDFMGHPATGKPIDVVGAAIVRVEGGKVVSLKEVFDLQALQQQIGIVAE